MSGEDRVTAYIRSLDSGDSPLLRRIAADARESFVPVIRRGTAGLLRTLVTVRRPRRILEVGTATGYSALMMAECAPPDCRITTVEKDAERAERARKNFALARAEDRIKLLEGDAADILPELDGPYEFIFLDAAKGQYLRLLPELLRLLAENGVLVSDNVLRGGMVAESRFAVERRDRTIHSRLREYLFELTHRPELRTAVIPLEDGAAVSVRIGGAGEETRPEERTGGE